MAAVRLIVGYATVVLQLLFFGIVAAKYNHHTIISQSSLFNYLAVWGPTCQVEKVQNTSRNQIICHDDNNFIVMRDDGIYYSNSTKDNDLSREKLLHEKLAARADKFLFVSGTNRKEVMILKRKGRLDDIVSGQIKDGEFSELEVVLGTGELYNFVDADFLVILDRRLVELAKGHNFPKLNAQGILHQLMRLCKQEDYVIVVAEYSHEAKTRIEATVESPDGVGSAKSSGLFLSKIAISGYRLENVTAISREHVLVSNRHLGGFINFDNGIMLMKSLLRSDEVNFGKKYCRIRTYSNRSNFVDDNFRGKDCGFKPLKILPNENGTVSAEFGQDMDFLKIYRWKPIIAQPQPPLDVVEDKEIKEKPLLGQLEEVIKKQFIPVKGEILLILDEEYLVDMRKSGIDKRLTYNGDLLKFVKEISAVLKYSKYIIAIEFSESYLQKSKVLNETKPLKICSIKGDDEHIFEELTVAALDCKIEDGPGNIMQQIVSGSEGDFFIARPDGFYLGKGMSDSHLRSEEALGQHARLSAYKYLYLFANHMNPQSYQLRNSLKDVTVGVITKGKFVEWRKDLYKTLETVILAIDRDLAEHLAKKSFSAMDTNEIVQSIRGSLPNARFIMAGAFSKLALIFFDEMQSSKKPSIMDFDHNSMNSRIVTKGLVVRKYTYENENGMYAFGYNFGVLLCDNSILKSDKLGAKHEMYQESVHKNARLIISGNAPADLIKNSKSLLSMHVENGKLMMELREDGLFDKDKIQVIKWVPGQEPKVLKGSLVPSGNELLIITHKLPGERILSHWRDEYMSSYALYLPRLAEEIWKRAKTFVIIIKLSDTMSNRQDYSVTDDEQRLSLIQRAMPGRGWFEPAVGKVRLMGEKGSLGFDNIWYYGFTINKLDKVVHLNNALLTGTITNEIMELSRTHNQGKLSLNIHERNKTSQLTIKSDGLVPMVVLRINKKGLVETIPYIETSSYSCPVRPGDQIAIMSDSVAKDARWHEYLRNTTGIATPMLLLTVN